MKPLANTQQIAFYCFIGLFIAVCSPVAHSITSPSKDISASQNESIETLFKKARKQESQKKYNKAINLYRQAAKKGHDEAQRHLANLYYYKKKDYKKAAYWLEKQAQHGNSDSQFHYANIFRFGLTGDKKYDIARYWYKRAANGDHKHAQYELALMYKYGLGSKKDKILANKWFAKAASNGHSEAKKVVRKYNKKAKAKSTDQNFIRKQQKLASQGNAEAQYKLGQEYLSGKKIAKNEKQAFKWFLKSANKDHASAQYTLAMMYFEGSTYLGTDLKKAKEWLVKAADNHNKKAEKKLNSLADEKHLEQQALGFERMLENAINGSVEDQYELGMRYLHGYKVSPDEKLAMRWIKEATKQHHALAQYQFGNYLLAHKKSEVDLETAIEYLALSAKQNVSAAQIAVKKFYEFGYAELIDATYGDVTAQNRIAQSYLNRAERQQKRLSVKWLELAANGGHIPSIITLAELYETGDLVTKNIEQAFNLYLEAAKIDNTIAGSTLDELLKQGIGSKENRQLALQILASNNSNTSSEIKNSLQFTELQ